MIRAEETANIVGPAVKSYRIREFEQSINPLQCSKPPTRQAALPDTRSPFHHAV